MLAGLKRIELIVLFCNCKWLQGDSALSVPLLFCRFQS
jgi:hypothetical protein